MKKSAGVYHIISIRKNGSESIIAVRRAGSNTAALKGWKADNHPIPGLKYAARPA